jgi:hypothetical protein
MRRIEGSKADQVKHFLERAADVAQQATCLRAKCGAVIVKDGIVIGEGYNSPPLNDELQRTCDAEWDYTKKPKYDKTCCTHAEWRAVLNACKENANKINGSTLYFMRVDGEGNFTDAGDPFCTTCSRFTMEAGVAEFALWNNDGVDVYSLAEYNQRSYAFYAR